MSKKFLYLSIPKCLNCTMRRSVPSLPLSVSVYALSAVKMLRMVKHCPRLSLLTSLHCSYNPYRNFLLFVNITPIWKWLIFLRTQLVIFFIYFQWVGVFSMYIHSLLKSLNIFSISLWYLIRCMVKVVGRILRWSSGFLPHLLIVQLNSIYLLQWKDCAGA